MLNNLDKMDIEKIQDLLDESLSIVDFMKKINVKDKGGNRKTFYEFIKKNNLDLKSLKKNRRKALLEGKFSGKKKPNEEIFIVDSKVNRSIVKKRILKENLIEYKCSKCGNEGYWNGETLILQLEHENGVGNDNRLENLKFLCPNCHSQTKSYAGKNFKSSLFKDREYLEEKEKKEENKKNKKQEDKKRKEKKIEERKKNLDRIDTKKYGWIKEVQKEWGVSHTQVKRWIEKYYPELDRYRRNRA